MLLGSCSFQRLKCNMLITSAVKRSKASAPKPALPVAGHGYGGLEKASVSSAAAVLRGCFPNGFQEISWNGSEEVVGETQSKALQAWFQLDAGGVEWQRKAWGEAIPGLGKSTIDAVLKKIANVKTFVLKKGKNSVTGERMQPWVKDLLQVFGAKKASPKAAAPMLAPKHAKPTPAPKAQGNSAGSGLEKAQTLDTESQEPATPPHDFGEHATETQSVVSTQSSTPAPRAVSSPVASLKGSQQGAAASSSGLKRPASKMKKPASKVQKVSEAWKPSPSFGFVKATKATAKSYIVSRESMKENYHLLVNVTAHASHSHHQVVDKLMALVTSQGGLNKAKVNEQRGEIIAGLQ